MTSNTTVNQFKELPQRPVPGLGTNYVTFLGDPSRNTITVVLIAGFCSSPGGAPQAGFEGVKCWFGWVVQIPLHKTTGVEPRLIKSVWRTYRCEPRKRKNRKKLILLLLLPGSTTVIRRMSPIHTPIPIHWHIHIHTIIVKYPYIHIHIYTHTHIYVRESTKGDSVS